MSYDKVAVAEFVLEQIEDGNCGDMDSCPYHQVQRTDPIFHKSHTRQHMRDTFCHILFPELAEMAPQYEHRIEAGCGPCPCIHQGVIESSRRLINFITKGATVDNPMCDKNKCIQANSEVRLLPTGGGANMIICYACFVHEMEYRRSNWKPQFEFPNWRELVIYKS